MFMQEKNKEIAFFLILILFCLAALGYLINGLINIQKQEKKEIQINDLKKQIVDLKEKLHIELENKTFDGLRFQSNASHPEAIKTALNYDATGDWVCVNVRGMDYGDIENTCNHECMHSAFSEIISESCEKNFSKCGELLDNWTT